MSDNKRAGADPARSEPTDRFILSPQLRVESRDVLRLQPENAVDTSENWDEFEEPPHVADSGDSGAPEASEPRAAREDSRVNGTEPQAFAPDAGPASGEAGDMPAGLRDTPAAIPGEATPGKASRVEELTAKIAALETAIARTSDQWEPDGDSRDAYSGTQSKGMTWQDSVDLDATGVPVEQTTDSQPSDKTEARAAVDALTDEQILDEIALRDLVSEIVRSELQGALGERITRNVRKLVRREIHRALAAKELE
ncbi:hypothetical protein KX928_07830 [Roseobacter sp. YSTF-M11]|uniref:Uncharacterized protein n=1 Tax=Roseobacter insulae TaxID=2859783 RepID=A0A9X1FVL5_9RHOB|nr:hypothetical protein [Roseobacter insulae]MBW4707693.1 hypothetical protein [Roseobacter insulae]